eukprot:TRINITY_DN2705_c0_g2_i1.p1 TRINITY_DN2705_c0_g2~~TRINITY_DN2705_c0_g2_i1.p1  ORF type:complete len:762 (+),score=166.38 TRINITY_DN2705_c0_g2_i1:50-2335(+)
MVPVRPRGSPVRSAAPAPSDSSAYCEFLKAVLIEEGWCLGDGEELTLKDCSGYGGAETYVVSAAGREAPWGVLRVDAEGRVAPYGVRMEAAAAALEGLTPPQLVVGPGWTFTAWGGDTLNSVKDTGEGRPPVAEYAEFFAKVHAVPATWFDAARAELIARHPLAASMPCESFAWVFLTGARLEKHGFMKSWDGWSEEVFEAYTQPGPLAPRHPAARRIVTLHGDPHDGNLLRHRGGPITAVDLELTCVGPAVHDVAFFCACYEDDEGYNRDAVIAAYLTAVEGAAPDAESVRQFAVDVMIHRLVLWVGGEGFWCFFDIYEEPEAEIIARGKALKSVVQRIRDSRDLQDALLADGLMGTCLGPLSQPAMDRYFEPWQARTDAARGARGPAALVVGQPRGLAHRLAEAARWFFPSWPVVTLHPTAHPALALQPAAPGSSALLLAEHSAGTVEQQWQWRRYGVLQHCASGLVLDADNATSMYFTRSQPWATATPAELRPHHAGSTRQRWEWCAGGELRQPLGGRVLVPNACEAAVGRGVYCGALLNRTLKDQFWTVRTHHRSVFSAAAWWLWAAVPERVRGWLQRVCAPPPELPPPRAPVVPDLPEDTPFRIVFAASRGHCLSVRSDGYTGDRAEVYCASVKAGAAAQLWTLVNGDTFRNVASGEFLHSEVKHVCVASFTWIWCDNHTDLVTRPQAHTLEQRWVAGPETYYGGTVLRHLADGRGVDVHGWTFKDGGQVGVENSVHDDCKGVSYVFVPDGLEANE